MRLNVLFLGKCEYREALAIQVKLLEKRQKGEIEDTLIILEHPPVITLGNQAEKSNIIASEEYLAQQGIDIIETNRGGDVTYHGTGQIVGYPIVDIRNLKIGVRDFVNGLEEVFIQLLQQELGIDAERDFGHTGVWIGNNKILAIGLAVKRGVTMHGFAFNVNTNLQHFNFIVPCGITDKGVTSVEKIMGKTYNIDEMNKKVVDYFVKVFNYQGFDIMEDEI